MLENKDFYPTPPNLIEKMCEGIDIKNSTILEPSAGKGNIVDYLKSNEVKDVLACENNEDLAKILQTKCNVIESDFLKLESHKTSHIDCIIMNPPFSNGIKHFLHAYEIAPKACKIVCLLNASNFKNAYTKEREQAANIIERLGNLEFIEDAFTQAERKTGVEIVLISITKEGQKEKSEFDGFFMEDESEVYEGSAGLMSYNVVRDLVNRYVQACKIYSELLTVKKRLTETTGSFFVESKTGVVLANLDYESYKSEMQKAGWGWIFEKMNLTKHTTRGLREDINKFVEENKNIPFTMKNIYHMLDIVVQTTGQRMNKAILEAFDRVTEKHHENRHFEKGWKTNLHYMVGKKFILPNIISPEKRYGYKSTCYTSLNHSYDGIIPDLEKALCYITGDAFSTEEYCNISHKWIKLGINTVNASINRNIYGEWYESHFFKYKGYKNGNMHFEFTNHKVWEMFNKKVAELKGYPLYESKEQTAYQKKNSNNNKN